MSYQSNANTTRLGVGLGGYCLLVDQGQPSDERVGPATSTEWEADMARAYSILEDQERGLVFIQSCIMLEGWGAAGGGAGWGFGGSSRQVWVL